MSPNRPMPPIGALIAALVIADVLQSKRDTSNESNKLPPSLEELLSAKCDACNPSNAPSNADKQQGSDGATDTAEQVHVSAAVEIPPEVAELVGMTKPDFDPDSLEGHTRLLAAAFIINVRKLGEQPVNAFPKAAATLSGIRYVENTVLAALHTFTTLAGK